MKRILILALAAAFIMSACGREAPKPQTVTFSLEANPTTGFQWQVTQSEELFKIERSYTENAHAEGMTGVGGIESFTLTPLKPGRTEITLTYARPWEGGEQANQLVYTFLIDRDLQVEMLDGYSTGVEEPVPVPTPVIA